MKKSLQLYFKLYITFFKIGLFTFGGGYAMLPLLQKEVVEKQGWATEEMLMNYYAIGQSTPGIIAINTATFVGYSQKKLLGGITATLGMVTPSWIIIMSIATFFKTFSTNPLIAKAFMGIRIMVVALILQAVYKMYKKNSHSKMDLLIAILGFITVGLLGISPIWVIIVCGCIGVILYNKKVEVVK